MHDGHVVELADEMDVVYLRRGKAMELKLRILRVERTKKVLVPFDVEIRMQPALHEHTSAAERDRFVDSFLDLLDGMNIRIGFSRSTIKSTESTDDVADVRVIYVPVDDVCDDVGRVLAHADLMCRKPDADEIV